MRAPAFESLFDARAAGRPVETVAAGRAVRAALRNGPANDVEATKHRVATRVVVEKIVALTVPGLRLV